MGFNKNATTFGKIALIFEEEEFEMGIGLFMATQWPANADLNLEMANLCEQTRLAKDQGFSSVMVGQHFLSEPLQMIQAEPLIARLAAEGEGMTFGITILLLAMQNPIIVAENAASLDWITDGNYVLGVGLGFGSTLLGKKAAMLCTASVEEVIDKHYQNQIDQLGPDEKDLKKKLLNLEKMSCITKILLMKKEPLNKVSIQ